MSICLFQTSNFHEYNYALCIQYIAADAWPANTGSTITVPAVLSYGDRLVRCVDPTKGENLWVSAISHSLRYISLSCNVDREA